MLLATAAMAQTTHQVLVPPGDLAALKQALSDALDGDPDVETVIISSGVFDFSNDVGYLAIRTPVVIRGQSDPIIFRGGEDGPARLLLVRPEGHLQLRNIELAGFSLTHSGEGLIVNRGKLELSQVQIKSLVARPQCGGFFQACLPITPIIKNSEFAQLSLDQVSLIDSGITGQRTRHDGGVILNDGTAKIQNTQFYFSEFNWAAPLQNNGDMFLENISMFISNYDKSFSNRPLGTASGANTVMKNSIVSGFSGAWCDDAISRGNNHIDSDQCSFAAEGDLTGKPAGLIWRPVVNPWSWRASLQKPLLSQALVPMASSLVVDSIDPEFCLEEDLLARTYRNLDGNGDGIGRCDKGAVELRPALLAEGGINGLYYNPDADGHYLSIIDNNYNTLLMWNTFDKNGNQAWVYGIGELVAGRSLVADAYIKKNGSLSPDGEILPADEERWGTLEVDMLSCREGTLKFQSDLPEFGSGQVRLVRLVLVKQLGCVD